MVISEFNMIEEEKRVASISEFNMIEEEKRVASQAVRMDELGGSWGQEIVMVSPDDYGILCLVLPSSFHLQPPSHPHR